MILDDIVRHKKYELCEFKNTLALDVLRSALATLPSKRDFKGVLCAPSPMNGPRTIRIIAEIKKASPSRGLIRDNFDPVEIAQLYEKNGAVAISVLTDRKYFQGNFENLARVKENISIPILDKDFIIDPYQLYLAKYYGADAVLLIVAILTDEELAGYLSIASQLDLDVMVEVHTHEELKRALATNAQIIGINNRDLKTFQVSVDTSRELVHCIPDDKIVVSESGIDSKDTLVSLRKEGVDAFLIGEAFMREQNIGKKLREFLN